MGELTQIGKSCLRVKENVCMAAGSGEEGKVKDKLGDSREGMRGVAKTLTEALPCSPPSADFWSLWFFPCYNEL